jgi:hypothetical protein
MKKIILVLTLIVTLGGCGSVNFNKDRANSRYKGVLGGPSIETVLQERIANAAERQAKAQEHMAQELNHIKQILGSWDWEGTQRGRQLPTVQRDAGRPNQ